MVEQEGGVEVGESDKEVVFKVREYTKASRSRVNDEVAMRMAGWDAPEPPA